MKSFLFRHPFLSGVIVVLVFRLIHLVMLLIPGSPIHPYPFSETITWVDALAIPFRIISSLDSSFVLLGFLLLGSLIQLVSPMAFLDSLSMVLFILFTALLPLVILVSLKRKIKKIWLGFLSSLILFWLALVPIFGALSVWLSSF